jgi:hypothetical protein
MIRALTCRAASIRLQPAQHIAMTPEGQKRADLIAAQRNDTNLGRRHADSYEDRPLSERCILGFNSGPPMTPGAYNNNVELFQAPGYVAC